MAPSVDIESVTEKSSIAAAAAPARRPAVSIAYHESASDANRRAFNKELTRTQSVSFTPKPAVSQPAHRVPAEFNTLSLHVTLTRDGDADGHTARNGKKSVKELASLDWQAVAADEAAARLGVNPARGLDREQAARRLSTDGPNLVKPKPVNWFKKVASYLLSGFNSLLLGAAILVFVSWKPLGEPNPAVANLALAIVLVVVVAFSAVFNAWQDFSTGRVMKSISGMLPSEVEVLRDGASLKVPAKDLVAGDIVRIGLGNKVPCDCRILDHTADAQFDRSILTGESEPVDATAEVSADSFLEAKNIALQGSLCIAGSVTALAILTGEKTVFGRIAKLTGRQTAGRTTLQKEVLHFVLIISALAFAVCVLIVILWAAWLRRDYPGFINVPNLLINLVSVAVAFIPEGLPICVTLSLSIIAQKMKRAKVLCKSLSTVETLGCVDVILSDKTGTLTTNRMTVVEVFSGLERKTVAALVGSDAEKAATSPPVQVALAACCALNNDASYEDNGMTAGERNINGDATDSGLLRFSDRVFSSSTARLHWNEIYKLAFNSKNKFAMKLFKTSTPAAQPILPNEPFDPSSDFLLLVKGAPDILIKRCTSILAADGSALPLDGETMEHLTHSQRLMASEGQRVLLLARRILSGREISAAALASRAALADAALAANEKLQIVGLVGLLDPARHDTPETVRMCRGAGIRFFMVTGDFALTASAIAKSCGIFTTDKIDTFSDLEKDRPLDQIQPYARKTEDERLRSLVLSGSDLLVMTDATWKQTVAYDEVVFARTTPEQKLKIVKAFQSYGHVCGATGDGTNDAAALKQADIGVAFGNGSAVAIEAADLVLLEDISAIVDGVRLGRLVFENLKRTILYLLPAGSFSELWPVLVSVLFGLPQPLSSIQMILICCMTDLLPGLSMVREQPESDLLSRNPRNVKKDHLADWRLLLHAYGFLGVLETLTSMISAYYFGFVRNGVPFSAIWLAYGRTPNIDPALLAEVTYKAQSIYFYNLVFMQFGNLLATRTRRLSIFQQDPFFHKSTRNLFIPVAMIVSVGLATLFSYIGGIQNVFNTRGVNWKFWLLPMAYGLAILVLDETRKLAIRTWPKSFLAKLAW